MLPATGGRKRGREDDDDDAAAVRAEDGLYGKKARPTEQASAELDGWFHHDSVLNTPTTTSQAREQPKYDSDDEESSSLVSEPGSPQDISMSSDEMENATFSQSPEDNFTTQPRAVPRGVWSQRLQTTRVPTPIVATNPGRRAGPRQHVRQRHPQENLSSDLLDVPSPIDEDEVPTPPSAAEAAGSQLSMLSVSDVDMANDTVPTISIDPARPSNSNTNVRDHSLYDMEPIHSGPDNLTVRKQRQRSGALSNGNSPVRAGPSNVNIAKRGFSMGFRADCEKCQMRVPGHMNHFIA